MYYYQLDNLITCFKIGIISKLFVQFEDKMLISDNLQAFTKIHEN